MADSSEIKAASAAFEAKYKYKIAGQREDIFSTLGPLLKQDFQINLLKSQRQRFQRGLEKIDNNSALSDSQKLKQKAELAVNSLSDATRTLRRLSLATGTNNILSVEGRDNKGIAAAANEIVKDLKVAVDQYTEGRAGLTDADYSADDRDFFRELQSQVNALKSVVSRTRTYLRQEGTIFSPNVNLASKNLVSIQNAIDTFDPTSTNATDGSGEGGATSGSSGTGGTTGTGSGGDTSDTGSGDGDGSGTDDSDDGGGLGGGIGDIIDIFT